MNLLYLPDPGQWAKTPLAQSPVTPRDTLNGSASTANQQQLTVAAENAPLRIVYGEVRIGAQISNVLGYNGGLAILAVWAQGECDSITELEIDDQALMPGVTATHHLGSAGQLISSIMVSAFAQQSPPVIYTDTLPGICYSVIIVPQGGSSGFPRLTATIKGRKVFDPRENYLPFSDTTTGWNHSTPTLVTNAFAPDNGIRVTRSYSSGDAPSKATTSGHVAGTYTASCLVDRGSVSDVLAEIRLSILGFDVDGASSGSLAYSQTTGLVSSTSAVGNATNFSATATLEYGTVWRFKITTAFSKAVTSLRIYCWLEVNGGQVTIGQPQVQAGSLRTAYYKTLTIDSYISGTRFSDNPALCLADFLINTSFGAGRSVDYFSASSVAKDCDELVGTTVQEKRRTINLALDRVQPTQDWVDTLRTYASCWLVPLGPDLKFVADKALLTAKDYSHSSGNIAGLESLTKRGVQNTPTVLTVVYRDTSSKPHRDARATVYADGVIAGTRPRRESTIPLNGVTRYSQAFREATERLNKLLLNDLSFDLEVFDDGIIIDVGDVVTVTHPVGLTAKPMRVMGLSGEYGDYRLNLVEYDPAVYNTSVSEAPTFVDTTLPNPSSPPAIGAVVMAEEVFQLDNGTFSSRWRVTWPAATYAYLAFYRAELYAGPLLIHSNSLLSPEWATPTVQENVGYSVRIAAVSSLGSTGVWSTQTGTAQGKQLVPSDVPAVSVFEAGGRVYASWAPSIDIDIWRYEVRYGAVGGSWETAKLIDRVDALRLDSDLIPVGNWVIYVKALDSVQKYSAIAASATVTVTSDASSFLINTYEQTAPTLTNMQEYSLARTDTTRYFVTEDGVTFGARYTSVLNAYGGALAIYHTPVTSTWLGEGEDFGLVLGGQWTGTGTVTDIGGTHVSSLGSSVDGSTYTYRDGLSHKFNARFARLRHESLGTATMQVVIPTQNVRLDAIPREEVGVATSSATGPVTVYLEGAYAAVKEVGLTPGGTSFATTTWDNVSAALPSATDKSPAITVTNGRFLTRSGAGNWESVRNRHALPSTGRWYWEARVTAGTADSIVGLMPRTGTPTGAYAGVYAGSIGYHGGNGKKYVSGSDSAYGSTYGAGDTIGVAWDADTKTITFYKNNVSQGAYITGFTSEVFPAHSLYTNGAAQTLSFAAGDLAYSPPLGYNALPFAFDAYVFNTTGTLIVREFYWKFNGV